MQLLALGQFLCGYFYLLSFKMIFESFSSFFKSVTARTSNSLETIFGSSSKHFLQHLGKITEVKQDMKWKLSKFSFSSFHWNSILNSPRVWLHSSEPQAKHTILRISFRIGCNLLCIKVKFWKDTVYYVITLFTTLAEIRLFMHSSIQCMQATGFKM